MIEWPPKIEAERPFAVLPVPPLTEALAKLAVLDSPPVTEVSSELAVLRSPPDTAAPVVRSGDVELTTADLPRTVGWLAVFCSWW